MNRTELPLVPEHAYVLYKEDKQWICTGLDFKNLIESPAGFGKTIKKAVRAYRADVLSLLEEEVQDAPLLEEEVQDAPFFFYQEVNDTWNHRILFHPGENGGEDWYGLHEVHYQKGEVLSWRTEGTPYLGHDMAQCKETFDRYFKALSEPVLVELPGAKTLVDWDSYTHH